MKIPRRNWCKTAITAICFIAIMCNTAAAIDVDQVVWGFDGKVVPFRFNPVSILISNPTPEAEDVTLNLYRVAGGDNRLGALVQEQAFLGPYSSRWVQFHAYTPASVQDWTLSWGRRPSQRHSLPQPSIGNPARVLLVSPDDRYSSGSELKTFDEDLFPPMLSALDALDVVFLDHVPRWQKPRRQALLDWVRRGGTLHLLQDRNGEFPEFTAELADLNTPLDRFRLRAGQVIRHHRRRSEVDRSFIDDLLGEQDPNVQSSSGWQADMTFFHLLKTITKPDHNWYMIHGMSLAYLAMICPGWYILGRKRTDYRFTLLAFTILAVVFSLAFNFVGRRGYGESTTVNSLAIARPLGDGQYDVTQWSNAFVTDGDNYRIQHRGEGRIYSTCQQVEAVNGIIDNGLDGAFIVDIPLFSTRTFAHRAKVSGPDIELRIQELRIDETVEELKVAVHGPLAPDAERTQRIHALYKHQIYPMVFREGLLELAGSPQVVSKFANLGQAIRQQYPRPTWDEDQVSTNQVYNSVHGSLVARALDLPGREDATEFSLPDDRIRLFIFANMPESFFIDTDRLGGQQGRVLYTFEIFTADTQ